MEPESAQGLEGTARARVPHSDGGGGRETRLEREAGEKGSVIKSWPYLRVLGSHRGHMSRGNLS